MRNIKVYIYIYNDSKIPYPETTKIMENSIKMSQFDFKWMKSTMKKKSWFRLNYNAYMFCY